MDISVSDIDYIRYIYSADILLLSCRKTDDLQLDYKDEFRIIFNDDGTYSCNLDNANQSFVYENETVQELYNDIISFFETD